MLPAEEGSDTEEAWLTASEQRRLGQQPVPGGQSFKEGGSWTALHVACAVSKPSVSNGTLHAHSFSSPLHSCRTQSPF